MAIIQLKQVSKSYMSHPVLRNIDFQVNEGDKVALIGENGSGKSTLMKIIADEVKADEGLVHVSKSVRFSYLSQQMEEFSDLSVKVLSAEHLDAIAREIQFLSQQMTQEGADVDALMRKLAAKQEEFEYRGGYSYLPRLAQALSSLGIQGGQLERPISTLSGGERMRVLMARRLMEQADVLLLDEPTNHLDIDGMEWLEEYLQSFKGSILFISHDRYFIDRIANKTAELNNGKLTVYKGNYQDYLEQKKMREEHLQKSIEALKEEKERQEEVTQTLLSHRKMTSYHARERVVSKLEDKIQNMRELLPKAERRMNFHFVPKNEKMDKQKLLLSLEEASMSWDQKNYLFKNVAFPILATDKKVIVGPNGSGKSTLLGMIMGNIQNFEGELYLSSGLRYGHLGQYTEFEDENHTVLYELMSRSDYFEGEARSLLARYGFRYHDVEKEIHVLSGGERARLYLCCLLEEEPDILFLDEPTNHLDIHSREVLEDAIQDFNGAVLAVSHDRYFIEKCSFDVLGFINQSLNEYASFSSYRHFAKIAQQQMKKNDNPLTNLDEIPEKEKDSLPDKLVKKNLGKLRKQKKELDKRISELEKEIHIQEEKNKELESSLQSSGHEVYQEYADAATHLESLYDEFFTLGEERDNIVLELDE